MATFDAILFDFDGVLADTEPLHFACWQEILAPMGVVMDWDFYRVHGVGVDDRLILRRIAEQANPPRDWETLWAQYDAKKELFRRKITAEPPFQADMKPFLGELQSRFNLAVVSSSNRAEIEAALAAGGLLECFSALVCGREAGAVKPAPEPYLMAARLLAAGRPLVVEDSEPGQAAGRAAGFEVLAVPDASQTIALVRGRLTREEGAA